MSLAKLKEEIAPLIDWMRENKPDVKRIALTRENMLAMQEAKPSVLQFYGFMRDADGYGYRGYELYCNVTANTGRRG